MKSNFKKLSHTMYECKYHIVFCPKYRHRILKGEVADYCRREYFTQEYRVINKFQSSHKCQPFGPFYINSFSDEFRNDLFLIRNRKKLRHDIFHSSSYHLLRG